MLMRQQQLWPMGFTVMLAYPSLKYIALQRKTS
jgi:hypothetical protein